ncbi:MAG: hypothetical protein OXD45_12155 [Rhodobacteraceae bacterium]|nr:hypothetical protein [Paracoccaceae bacterium]MCY4307498.1 hypothetical protein [Paracoccaceae bacterium]
MEHGAESKIIANDVVAAGHGPKPNMGAKTAMGFLFPGFLDRVLPDPVRRIGLGCVVTFGHEYPGWAIGRKGLACRPNRIEFALPLAFLPSNLPNPYVGLSRKIGSRQNGDDASMTGKMKNPMSHFAPLSGWPLYSAAYRRPRDASCD